ncbi:MAG: peptidase M20 family protein [uncultured archaeon A07HR60]|jgi:Acetylornithine deacetylase/Succinyl-diaminopimelate desuccinylase and related deacylases|nr:MAG: peptidase M20 family protein [uncultured archaeon A07HR60]
MSELTDLVRQLVSTPSHRDEAAVARQIESWLRAETSATVTRDDAGNVIARDGTTAGSDAPTLALVGHHDVVPPASSQVRGDPDDPDAYTIETRDGRLYGRGTADMKGAVAACLVAFRDASPDCELVFASFSGEETGGDGARAAIEQGFAPDYAVIAEGSTNYSEIGVTDVVVAHKGRRASKLLASGRSAHASEPDTGVNAIYRASDAIDVVRDLEPPTTVVRGAALSGSVAVTEVEGGQAWNMIPEECVITIDERTVPDERTGVSEATNVDGVEHVVEQDLPPMACSDDAFADTALKAATAVQPGSPSHVTKPHATDAGWLAAAGTATIVCGPAEPDEAHTDTESVSVEVLQRCERIYRELAEQL